MGFFFECTGINHLHNAMSKSKYIRISGLSASRLKEFYCIMILINKISYLFLINLFSCPYNAI